MLKKYLDFYGNITLQELMNKLEHAIYIDVYTDGASQYKNGNRQSGIGVYFGDQDIRNVSKLVDQHDNDCELLACIEALFIVQHTNQFVRIYTDSRLVSDGMNGRCTKNKFLFVELTELVKQFIDVQFIFVKGHDGNEGNEKADALSRLQFL